MCTKQWDKEVYEGMLIAVLAVSQRKVKAGIRYAASGEHQDYPVGVMESGVALDAVDMMVSDIMNFIAVNDNDRM